MDINLKIEFGNSETITFLKKAEVEEKEKIEKKQAPTVYPFNEEVIEVSYQIKCPFCSKDFWIENYEIECDNYFKCPECKKWLIFDKN